MSAQTGQGLSARHQGVAALDLPLEGMLPSFEGANGWLNSQPLTPSDLRGHVVVVQFWTYTCIDGASGPGRRRSKGPANSCWRMRAKHESRCR
jgi:hypothetical protein